MKPSGLDERKLGDLLTLISELGKGGGAISPSVYDTARSLKFCPPAEGVEPALRWLKSQQLKDGGWGNPIRTHTRDVPTIAALLAFAQNPAFPDSEEAVEAGVAFLHQHHKSWAEILPEDLPVGMELIMPRLLAEATETGLPIPKNHYRNLFPTYKKKINYIRTMPLPAASPPTFSWEAWGDKPNKKWLDPTGGVGHNPTATAYWIYLSQGDESLAEERERAKRYLANAARAAGTGIPGVVPSAWPINRFEQVFALHTLFMADLFDFGGIKDALQEQIIDLRDSVRPDGVGFSDYFTTDGDDTAATMSILCAAGYSVDQDILDQFASEDHFSGYIDELQASHSVTARAIYALRHLGDDTTAAERYLIEHQLPNGAWPGDKWNVSQFYGTCLAVFALKDSDDDYLSQLQAAADFLIDSQLEDGGWGVNGVSKATDTSYAILAAYSLLDLDLITHDVFEAGQGWLNANYAKHGRQIREIRWLNKLEYSPYRIDQAFLLAALFATPKAIPQKDIAHIIDPHL